MSLSSYAPGGLRALAYCKSISKLECARPWTASARATSSTATSSPSQRCLGYTLNKDPAKLRTSAVETAVETLNNFCLSSCTPGGTHTSTLESSLQSPFGNFCSRCFFTSRGAQQPQELAPCKLGPRVGCSLHIYNLSPTTSTKRRKRSMLVPRENDRVKLIMPDTSVAKTSKDRS